MKRQERIDLLKKSLKERILVVDGAMGTAIQDLHLSPEDFGGSALDGCNENLVLTCPQKISEIHQRYLDAGADIIETNTFGGTPLVLGEYGLENHTVKINQRAAEIARECVDACFSDGHPCFVAGSMGPTTKAISVTGGVTFSELSEHYYEQAKGLHAGGVDFFLIETCQDTRNVKSALVGIEKLFCEGASLIPIAVSGTIEATGTMLAGQSIEAFWASLAHVDLLYIGLNCATGPEFMTDHLRSLAKLSGFPIGCVPNAGLPDENGRYLETPEMMASVLSDFANHQWVNVIGGCCGTTPAHTEKFVDVARKYTPRKAKKHCVSFLSGIDYLEIEKDQRPTVIGERTNVIGSRKFKSLIESGDFEAAAEIARKQIRNGAQIIDICLANPDRNELEDMESFLEQAIKMIRVPLMIDSTDANVIAKALTYSQGKAIINSINLEDGEERFEKVVPLAKKFGAALVVGTIDEDPVQGMAITRERKLEIAKRSFTLLTQKYGIPPEDIYWDALVFPCATGDEQYFGSAVETIEGVGLLKKEFPQTKTILGISNVSFGLPPLGREVLNSVFLYHCVQAGLDTAIVNSQQLKRYPSIPEEERKLAEDLLWSQNKDPIACFTEFYRSKVKTKTKVKSKTLSLEERLANYVIEGTKEGLISDLKQALKKYKPLEIINGPLMTGMDQVGQLFAKNELIVAEVLQSAEAMKAAVAYLEPLMEKKESSIRGKVILATVKGDVHDIGKNLVDIILSNNGFKVINLGIKITPEKLIAAAKEHNPQIIGLSGLLVKSAHQMVVTADDLAKAGIEVSMLVGGAALSRSFVDRKISKAYLGTVEYASDAMNGLELAKIMVTPNQFEKLKSDLSIRRSKLQEKKTTQASIQPFIENSNIEPVLSPPQPPDYERHVLTNTPLEQIWSFINPRMLLGRHLGLPNSAVRHIENQEWKKLKEMQLGKKAFEVLEIVDEIKTLCLKEKLLQPKAIYRFFRAEQDQNQIFLYSSDGVQEISSIHFPRQKKPPFLCLADYLQSKGMNGKDNLCLFTVTAGHGVREKSQELKNQGEYLKSHTLSALALESAEAYAEFLHKQIRRMWNLHDSKEMTMMQFFQAQYQGKRYSFGYPACPDLEGQEILFHLLRPQEIGINLTEGYMMDPEASVSALVFHHPQASYFSV